MATKIILKKSSTVGAIPLSTDLEIGEVALNLADRKLYTKDNSNNVVQVGHPYVGATAPTSPAEGDLWYDSVNDALMAYDGTAWQSAGYQNLSELEDVTITSIAAGEILKWNGSSFVNNTLAEADIQAASNTEADSRAAISVTDAGGDGSLSYNSTSGVITYTGPSAAEVQAHITGGTGVTVTNGSVAIGQAVETTSDVTFNDVTMTGELKGPATFTIDPAAHGDDTGTVVIAGNLTVNGTTTSVNSNEVNIGDSIIVLNSDETGAPSQNGGFEIERGTATNVSFIWDETSDYWSLGGEELANVTIDGGAY